MKKQQMGTKQDELVYIPLNDTENYFYSTDLGITATLISIGFELVSLDTANSQKVVFIIKKQPNIDELINEYFSNQLMVPARSFFENVKMLKNRIYNSL
jgi:hypothetical protein